MLARCSTQAAAGQLKRATPLFTANTVTLRCSHRALTPTGAVLAVAAAPAIARRAARRTMATQASQEGGRDLEVATLALG